MRVRDANPSLTDLVTNLWEDLADESEVVLLAPHVTAPVEGDYKSGEGALTGVEDTIERNQPPSRTESPPGIPQ